MEDKRDSLAEVLRQAAQGDAAAQERFVHQYGPHLLRVVRRQLPRWLRSRFDSVDVVQDVWASFFAQAVPTELWHDANRVTRYLTQMASKKLIEGYRQQVVAKNRDLRREVPIEEVPPWAHSLCTKDPTASQVAVADDQWDHWLQNLPPHYVRILQLRREGKDYDAIAQEVGVSARTVARVLHQLQATYEGARHD